MGTTKSFLKILFKHGCCMGKPLPVRGSPPFRISAAYISSFSSQSHPGSPSVRKQQSPVLTLNRAIFLYSRASQYSSGKNGSSHLRGQDGAGMAGDDPCGEQSGIG